MEQRQETRVFRPSPMLEQMKRQPDRFPDSPDQDRNRLEKAAAIRQLLSEKREALAES